jgi:hypothetical protein
MFSEVCDRWPGSTTFFSKTLSDFDALPERIQAEVAESNAVVNFVPLVGAWSRKPKGDRKREQALE